MKLRLAATLAALGAVVLAAYDSHASPSDSWVSASLVEVAVSGRSDVSRLEALGLDVTHDVGPSHAVVVLHGADDRHRLELAGFRFQTIVADLAALDRRERAADRAYTLRMGASGSALPSGRTEYRSLEDYALEMQEITETYPAIVRLFTLAERSLEGRALEVLEIAEDVLRPDDGRPTFILNAMHHAREWPSSETAMEFARDLVQGYGSNPRITALLRDVRVLVMPLTNPDGFRVSREWAGPDPDESTFAGVGYGLAAGVAGGGSLGYKRKNCNPIVGLGLDLPCELDLGVDPNRNYSHQWGGPGASSNPHDQSYRGSGPFSEPESRAVRDLVLSRNATMLLSIHNVAAMVLRPPGLETDGSAPDEDALAALGARMAEATRYANLRSWELYDTTGTTAEWSYATTGGFAYTIEMDGSSFHGRYQRHVVEEYIGWLLAPGGLREAYLLAAEAARDPEQTSRIAGSAPPGRTLRITRDALTDSSAVCLVVADPVCAPNGEVIREPERIEITTVVPPSGSFEWWVNPSTRPYVKRDGGTEAYTLACEQDGAVLETVAVVIDRGETKEIDLECTS